MLGVERAEVCVWGGGGEGGEERELVDGGDVGVELLEMMVVPYEGE